VRLAQVFANLLNNAAKYTPEGGAIRFTATRTGEQAVVHVQDNGGGIPGDVLPHIFDLFTQANRSLARSEGGLGIGLTVVRNLLEKHGGSVEARSAGAGKGSEFIVRLPVMTERPQEATRPQVEPAPATGACRILLVDDNADSNEALNLLLTLDGHDVRQAPDGAEALRIAHEFKPQLVLCDIGLPDMDGYQVVRCLREQSGDAMPAVAALTGYARPADSERIRQAGFICHLVKPIDPQVLVALIAAHGRQPHPERSGAPDR
jgi:CheY-like chemotaxis protein